MLSPSTTSLGQILLKSPSLPRSAPLSRKNSAQPGELDNPVPDQAHDNDDVLLEAVVDLTTNLSQEELLALVRR